MSKAEREQRITSLEAAISELVAAIESHKRVLARQETAIARLQSRLDAMESPHSITVPNQDVQY